MADREEPEKGRKLTIDISARLLKQLRLAAVQNDTTVRDLITKMIEAYLRKRD